MKPSNEKPTAAEFGQLRSWLAQKGVKQADINKSVPAGAHSILTRHEITARLQQMCKSFPKGL